MTATKIKIVLELDANDIQALLDAANCGEADEALQLADLTGKEFRDLKADIVEAAGGVKQELIEWLIDWAGDQDDD